MAYHEKLAARVREIIARTHDDVEEKAMFGGLCFMVNGKMCVGVEKERLMVRFNPELQDELLEKPGCHPMDFTGKPMRGYVFVDVDVLGTEKKLLWWMQKALEFNAVAKSSKKKKK